MTRYTGGNPRGKIFGRLYGYAGKNCDAYHTPGHKGMLDPLDITEIGNGGDIFPGDVVAKAEHHTAALYGVKKLRYLVNGSSIGIKAALWQFRGKKVLYAPGAHTAFSEGCTLAGINAVAAYGEDSCSNVYTCSCGFLPPPLTLRQAQIAIKENPDAAALYITSPDYFGRTADIRITELCRTCGIALIADSAHGAHFAFAPGLGKFRFDNIADFCNMSAHKTLGAYTQTAFETVNDPAYYEPFDKALSLFGTTSPNYVLLAALEESAIAARDMADEYLRIKEFSQKLAKNFDVLDNSDYTRIALKPEKISAHELFRRLYGAGITAEAVIEDRLVFILTPFDDEQKLGRLYRALTENL